jgi:hypothetical protein
VRAFFTQPPAVDVAYGHAWDGLLEAPLVRGDKPLDLPGMPVGLPCDLPTFLTNPDDHAYLDLLVNQFALAAMAGCGGAGVGPARGGGEAGGGKSERVPQIGDGGEVPSIEGMERGF